MRFHVFSPNHAFALLSATAAASLPEAAQAYVGPGAGLTAIGTMIALVAAVGLALVGFVWYPAKRMMKNRTNARKAQGSEAGGQERGE